MKILFQPEKKGWFKALGLHHASIVGGTILLGHIFGFGTEAAYTMVGWYSQREWGYGIKPPKYFEIMDWLSPVLLATTYIIIN